MIKKPFALYFIVFLLIASCSTKKNTFKNRNYHKLTAWFNTLFNGQEAMDKRLEELRESHKDNYFETLSVNPYDSFEVNDNPTYIEAPAPPRGQGIGGIMASGNLLGDQTDSNLGGFEKAEEKALKAIANHSMTIKGEERNKLIARAYLMLGQARYFQGKPFQALDALEQVKKLPFDKHKATANYFAALANMQAGNKFAAVEILDELYKNYDLDKQLIADVAKAYAWLYYEEDDLTSALNGLDRAIEYSRSKKERARLNFIQGQMLTELGKIDEANAKFARAYKLKPGFEMEARSKVFTALNFDPNAHNYSDYKKELLEAYKIGTYETYRNEFLYALGKIEEKRDSVQLAESTYARALREEMSDPGFRAETYAALGDLKFKQDDYVYASAYYDSATQVVPEGKRREEITMFRDNLKQVMDKYYLVQRNDSILKLTTLSSVEQENYFKDYIEKLKERDALQAEQESKVEETVFLTDTSKKGSFFQSLNSNQGKFYFYSNTAKSNGETEFKRIWGNRSLKDNWRLANASEVSIEEQKAQLTGNVNANNPRRYEVDFYIEQIPSDPMKISNLKIERDTVELSLGLDYADKFKSRKRATETLEHLVNTPPADDDILLQGYYNLYRINKEKNVVVSNRYKDLILNNYPNSRYASFILNPQVDFTEENDAAILALYEKAYQAYIEEDYVMVRNLTSEAVTKSPKAEIIAKFLLLKANVDAKLLGREAYIKALENVYVLYPEKEEGMRAKEILDKLNKNINPKDKAPTSPTDENTPLQEVQKNGNQQPLQKPNPATLQKVDADAVNEAKIRQRRRAINGVMPVGGTPEETEDDLIQDKDN
ncbi:MAG: tetratricopeptide repeat protein [Weeksellaceae bacterium]